MDTLDDELRRALAFDISGDAEAALAGVHELNRRRTAWRAAARGAFAVACVIAVMVVLGGRQDSAPAPTVLDPGPSVDLTGAIPWNDRTDVEEYNPSRPSGIVTAPRCTAADLEQTGGNALASAGHTGTWFDVKNVSEEPCSLSGYPELVGDNGPVDAAQGTFFSQPDAVVSLEPGSIAKVVVETSLACDPQTATIVVPNLQLRLDDGTLLNTWQKLESSCPIKVGRWESDASAPPTLRFRALTADLEAPPSVRSGDPLVYVVTLRNKSDRPVELEPCPAYNQSISPPGEKPVSYGTWRLNCDSVGTLAPGQEVRFEMRLPVPADVHGQVVLRWYLENSPPNPTPATISVLD